MAAARESVEVFYSYVHEDERLCTKLEKCLSSLKRQGFITEWHARQIVPGTEWANTITSYLNRASIILLLISPDFMASDYCYTVEMKRAMERHNRKEAWVIPILLRPTDLEGAPFEKLQLLPTNAKPVTAWHNKDEAFLDVTRGIRRVIAEELKSFFSSSTVISSSEQFWNVPYPRNLFFTGQEALLSSLHRKLQGDQGVALTQSRAINGLGGIGKTQVALEYAYRYRVHYKTILWASADSYDSLVLAFMAISHYLHLSAQNAQDQSEIVRAVKHWLETHDQWLLIFDNADDPMLLHSFLPLAGKGRILFTTRAKALGPLAQEVEEVQPMNDEDGMLFLLRRARILSLNDPLDCVSDADRTAALEIVQELGGLPLALDQAGAYIEETACSISDYVDRYQTERTKLLQRRGKFDIGHPEPVATTWSLNFGKIEQINPLAAELLRLCAFFHPDSIPEEFITREAIQVNTRLRMLARDFIALDEAMQVLQSYSLVYRDARTKTLSVHRLVQVVQKDKMNEEQQQYWATQVEKIVSKIFPFPSGDSTTWSLCERYLLQAQACADLIKHWKITTSGARSFLHNTGHYLYERALYREATLLWQQELTANELEEGSTSLNVAHALSHLALAYDSQGHYKQAMLFNQRALTIYEHTQKPDRDMMAGTLTNLAKLYQLQGSDEQAALLYQRALALLERELDPGSLDMLHSFTDLTESHDPQTHNEQAIPLRNITGLHEQRYSPSTAENFHNLGMLHHAQGNYKSATSLIQRALTIYEGVPDPDHLAIAKNLFWLAIVYSARDQMERAELLLQRALALHEKVLGSDHPTVADDLVHLARIISYRGQYEQTESLLLRALVIYEKNLGSDHSNVTRTLSDLAQLYCKRRKFIEAVSLFNRVLELDKNNVWVISRRGETLLNMGRYEEALADLDRAISLDEKNDRNRYYRAQVHLHVGHLESFRADILIAIELAQAERKRKPDDYRVGFNLALYHLLQGEKKEDVKVQFEQLITACVSSKVVQGVLNDMINYLALHPTDDLALSIHAQLQKCLTQDAEQVDSQT